jgi:4-hydroxy-tetrahydrodipicolinate reductase
MRIALIGCGNMGLEVQQAAREVGLEIGAIFTSRNNLAGQGLSPGALTDIDVCVDFSTPHAVVTNIQRVAEAGKAMVVGTTGWYDRLSEVIPIVEKNGVGFVYGPNFSVGVNLLFRIVAYTAGLLKGSVEFDPYIVELHHRKKADHPSGTALQLSSILLEHLERKTEVVTSPVGRIPADGLSVAAIRAGSHPGTHVVGFDALYETIEISHQVRNRRVFASGAILAARWIKDRRGIYKFSDILDDLLQGGKA